MLVKFKNSEPVDHLPDAHRITRARARALARMVTDPQRRELIPLHLLPAACTLNALAMKGMGAELIAKRTGGSRWKAQGLSLKAGLITSRRMTPNAHGCPVHANRLPLVRHLHPYAGHAVRAPQRSTRRCW